MTIAGTPRDLPADLPHATEGLALANDYARAISGGPRTASRDELATQRHRTDPAAESDGRALSARPLPINERPHDNEYEWKGNPYQLDGWLKPIVTAMQFACDDPQVAWFCDSAGRIFVTFDRGGQWQDMTSGLMGARVPTSWPLAIARSCFGRKQTRACLLLGTEG